MPDANDSKRLQQAIVAYSALGMIVVGVAVGLVGVLPLAQRLREAEQRNLLVELQKQTVAVEQFLNRVRSAATWAGNRTRIREKLEDYNKDAISIQSLTSTIDQFLHDSMSATTNIAGICYFDVKSNLIAQFGLKIPREYWTWPEPIPREVSMIGPIKMGEEVFLVASATIFGGATNPLGTAVGPPVGTAIVLHRTQGLQDIVEDYKGKTGENILGSRQNKALPIFFPPRQARSSQGISPQRTAAIMEGLQFALERRSDFFVPDAPMDDSVVMAYGPIKSSDGWGLIVSMDRSELFSSINHKLMILCAVLVMLIVAGTFGMVVVLRPLTGRIILQTDELESQIYEKTAALNTELAERKRAEQSLRDSEALYHSLVDTLPINILRKDLRGRITYGNRGYCERMGRPLSALLGKSDYDLFPKALAEKYCTDDEKVIRTGEMFEDIEEHRAGDGKKLYVHVLKAPVRDARSAVVGTQVIFWDVTARRLAEEALEKAAAELARSNKELEQFAYVASHDLQEPLRMITSYTQLIAKRYKEKLDDDAKEFMHFAVDGALRMQKLIQGLLEYSRIGTRGKPFEETNAGEALDGALANLKLALDESGAVVTRDVLPKLMADPVQLTQLFQNLIGNALKFRGEQPPRIHVGVERQARADAAPLNMPPYEWIFHVQDNGIGIDPQYFERIFVIFQRLHTQDQYPGTGIGLAVCKKIVERHGGRIWVESKPGRGAAFCFALPALD